MICYQLLYVSKASDSINESLIDQIIGKAKDYNEKNGITGILLYRGEIFLQLLEGEKSAVERLFQKIAKDRRHANLTRIFEIEENERIFPNWAMGYREVTDLDVKMVGEFLSWNKLINAAHDIDNNLILHMLNRFKSIELS